MYCVLINYLQGLENRRCKYIMIYIYFFCHCCNMFQPLSHFKIINLSINDIICLLSNFYFWKNTLNVSFVNYSLLMLYKSFQSTPHYLKGYFYTLPVHFIKTLVWFNAAVLAYHRWSPAFDTSGNFQIIFSSWFRAYYF